MRPNQVNNRRLHGGPDSDSDHEFGLNRKFVRNDSVVSVELDGETVLLHLETGIYFGLDPVGTHIWSLLSEELDEGRLAQRLAGEFDVEDEILRADLTQFLTQLEEHQLVLILES